MAETRAPVIVIVGMPGAGKTTLSRALGIHLQAAWLPVELSVDDTLDIQCPPGEVYHGEMRLYRRGRTEFVLHDRWRPSQMRLAVAGLLPAAAVALRVLPAGAKTPVVIFEIPTTEFGSFRDLASGAFAANAQLGAAGVILLETNPRTRRDRNETRPSGHVLSDHVLSYFEQTLAMIDVTEIGHELAAIGWRVEMVDGERAVARVRDDAAVAVEAILASYERTGHTRR